MASTQVLVERPGFRLSMTLSPGRERNQLEALASVVPPTYTWWCEEIGTKALLEREAAE